MIEDLHRYTENKKINKHGSLAQFVGGTVGDGIHIIGFSRGNLYVDVEDRGAPTTIVYLHAAASAEVNTYPLFTGRNVANQLNANAIYLSDPCLDQDVSLGWFIGDSERQLQRILPEILRHCLGSLSNHRHLVLFGASGGGFASLYYSTKFEGSLAVSVNPQTDILKYLPAAVEPYLEKCWGLTTEDEFPFGHELLSLYRSKPANRVLYIQNLGDRPHVRNHLVPFLGAVADSGFSGIDLIEGRWGIGHRAPSSAVLIPVLQSAVESNGDWKDAGRKWMTSESASLMSIDERSTRYIIEQKKLSR